MIPRAPLCFLPLHGQAWATAVLLLSVAFSLQGCGESKAKKSAEPVEEEKSPGGGAALKEDYTPLPSSPRSNVEANNMSWCDPMLKEKSDEFVGAVQQDAKAYHDGMVSAFSDDFVKYPFCLENDAFLVHDLELKLRAETKNQGLTVDMFEQKLDQSIKDQAHSHEKRWKQMCQKFIDKNRDHQLSNLDMVRSTLHIDIDDKELKAQIAAFWHFQPWWDFFNQVAGSGCIRRYTDNCEAPVKVAQKRAQELVAQSTGNIDLSWYAFEEDPTSVDKESPQEGIDQRHGKREQGKDAHLPPQEESFAELNNQAKVDDPGLDSFLQARQRKRPQQMVPIELRAGGHQVRSHPKESLP